MPVPDTNSILEHLATAVLVLDSDLAIELANPAAEMLLETSTHQLHGVTLDRLLPTAQSILDCVRRARDSEIPHAELEIRVTLSNRREITLNCAATPLLEPGSRPRVLLEMSQLDRQLRISREELRLNQHQASMTVVRGLAHEIKNPLGGLRGAAQLLEQELEQEALKEYTSVIMNEADRLRSLVDRMLGPNSRPAKQSLNIHEVLELVRNLISAEAESGVRIVQDYDPSIPDVHGDRDLLIQAVLNIARNALQALGREGVITLRTRILRQLTIAHKRHRLVVNISIIDNGPGIPAELIERIFYPMVTGRTDGTGLGLMIAQSMINQHDGLIECHSQPGNTRFDMLLPVDCQSAEIAAKTGELRYA